MLQNRGVYRLQPAHVTYSCTQNMYFLKMQINKKCTLFFLILAQGVHQIFRIVYLSNFGGLNFLQIQSLFYYKGVIHTSVDGQFFGIPAYFDLLVTLDDPYMTFDPTNELHFSHGFSWSYLVGVGILTFDPGWTMCDLWPIKELHSNQGLFKTSIFSHIISSTKGIGCFLACHCPSLTLFGLPHNCRRCQCFFSKRANCQRPNSQAW